MSQSFSSLKRGAKLQQTFAAFKHRNFRLWFGGQVISLFGTWMQSTAQGFLIFELTQSPAYLGYVSFAAGVPVWLLMLFGGVVADRIARRTLLLLTQTVMMLLALILAGLAFFELVQPWHILVLAFALGVATAFDAPARQAFLVELVGREDLTNAIALNSTMFNTAVSIGPAAGGLIYALFGPAWCFLINGVSFLAIIFVLLKMDLAPRQPAERRNSTFADLREGFRFVSAHPLIRVLFSMIGVFTLFAMSYATLLPAWAVKVLGGDATTNGLLQSARGIGALIGSLWVASIGRAVLRGRMVTYSTFLFPILLIVFSLVREQWLALAVLLCVGAAVILMQNLTNSMLQSLVSDRLRGRVMSIYTTILFGVFPLGGLLAGAVAEYIGEPVTVMLGAAVALGCAIVIWILNPGLRRTH